MLSAFTKDEHSVVTHIVNCGNSAGGLKDDCASVRHQLVCFVSKEPALLATAHPAPALDVIQFHPTATLADDSDQMAQIDPNRTGLRTSSLKRV